MNSHTSEIKKYLELLCKKRVAFFSVSLLLISLVIFYSYSRVNIYEASSTVFIERNMINTLMKNIAITPSMSDRIRVLRHYMLSRDLILRTLKDLDVDVRSGSPEVFEAVIKEYQQKTSINVKGGDLFVVSLRDPDPVFAKNFVNMLVEKYVEENISSKREEAYGANRFLNEQVEYFKGKLDGIQREITDFRRERGVYAAVDEASIIEEIGLAKEELKSLRLKKNELLATEKTIQGQLDGEYPILVDSVVAGSVGGVGGGYLAAMEARLAELLLTYTESYPAVIKLRAEIEAKRGEDPVSTGQPTQRPESLNADPVYVDLKMKLFAVQSEIKGVEARERDLWRHVRAKEGELNSIPEEKKILADLEREKSTYAGLYNKLLAQMSRTEVSKQMEIGDKSVTFRIVDPAVLSTVPVNVKRVKLMLFGVLGGFLGGIAIVVLWDRFDGTFKELNSLGGFGIPIVAEIPRIANPDEDLRRRRHDLFLYGAVLAHLSIVAFLFVHDLLGLSVVDRLVANSHLGRVFQGVVGLIN